MHNILKQKANKKQGLAIFKHIFLLLLLASCSTIENIFKYPVPLQTVSIVADPDANYNSATDLDLVVVSDKGVAQELGSMSAKTYFSKKEDLENQYPDKIKTWHWEPVPGKKKSEIAIEFDEFQPEAAYVFAKYNNNSDNRVLLKPATEITIILKRTIFQIHSVSTED